jgi:nucleoside-diphosphate-sugar epimerase
MSKIAQEAVARTCARLFDLPVTIARMNASYGTNGGLPTQHLDALLAGGPVTTRWDPCMYSPIHQDDINAQTEALLDAASVPTTIVNWAGDEPVSVQEYCAYIGELGGFDPVVNAVEQPGTLRGSVADNTKRLSLTGPCQVTWREGIKRVFDDRRAAGAGGASA